LTISEENLVVSADERRRIVSMAYRMLGTVSDAEDAVQEGLVRWYRMGEPERAVVTNPSAWLMRVTSRVCLDVLGSARARRERYIGEWLPEPVGVDFFAGTAPARNQSLTMVAPGDPLERVTLGDEVSTALLVVLDTMTPAERVAFILHDVFAMPFDEIAETVGRSPAAVRHLASTARKKVRAQREQAAPRPDHDAVVHAFLRACEEGDLDALLMVLDPSVELRSDGGGFVSAARNPVFGERNVGRFLLGVLVKRPKMRMLEKRMPGGLGYEMVEDGRVIGVANLRVVGNAVRDVWIQMNPEKLRRW
jgi:RNA polymerase sigma-70 factor (ECF subfamily)